MSSPTTIVDINTRSALRTRSTASDLPRSRAEKSAIEWVMERYAVTVDKDSKIRNDPNAWSDDPRYIVDLIKRVVRVMVEITKIMEKFLCFRRPLPEGAQEVDAGCAGGGFLKDMKGGRSD